MSIMGGFDLTIAPTLVRQRQPSNTCGMSKVKFLQKRLWVHCVTLELKFGKSKEKNEDRKSAHRMAYVHLRLCKTVQKSLFWKRYQVEV